MAPRTFSTCARQRLYTFARQLATPLSDSRRRRFVSDMIPGLVLANHVHLSKIDRAAQDLRRGTDQRECRNSRTCPGHPPRGRRQGHLDTGPRLRPPQPI
jgi:hypothetical protein